MNWVTIHHSDTGNIARVTEDAAKGIWESRGWTVVDKDNSKLSRRELDEIAEKQGVDVSGAKSKADVVEALNQHKPQEA